jgi:hypothetical protein
MRIKKKTIFIIVSIYLAFFLTYLLANLYLANYLPILVEEDDFSLNETNKNVLIEFSEHPDKLIRVDVFLEEGDQISIQYVACSDAIITTLEKSDGSTKIYHNMGFSDPINISLSQNSTMANGKYRILDLESFFIPINALDPCLGYIYTLAYFNIIVTLGIFISTIIVLISYLTLPRFFKKH